MVLLLGFAGCDKEKEVGILDLQVVIERAPVAQSFQEKLDLAGKEIEDRFADESQEADNEERMAIQQKAYQEYLTVKQEYEDELNLVIEKAVAEVVKEEKLSVVIYKQAVRYGGIDITDHVIEKLQ